MFSNSSQGLNIASSTSLFPLPFLTTAVLDLYHNPQGTCPSLMPSISFLVDILSVQLEKSLNSCPASKRFSSLVKVDAFFNLNFGFYLHDRIIYCDVNLCLPYVPHPSPGPRPPISGMVCGKWSNRRCWNPCSL